MAYEILYFHNEKVIKFPLFHYESMVIAFALRLASEKIDKCCFFYLIITKIDILMDFVTLWNYLNLICQKLSKEPKFRKKNVVKKDGKLSNNGLLCTFKKIQSFSVSKIFWEKNWEKYCKRNMKWECLNGFSDPRRGCAVRMRMYNKMVADFTKTKIPNFLKINLLKMSNFYLEAPFVLWFSSLWIWKQRKNKIQKEKKKRKKRGKMVIMYIKRL